MAERAPRKHLIADGDPAAREKRVMFIRTTKEHLEALDAKAAEGDHAQDAEAARLVSERDSRRSKLEAQIAELGAVQENPDASLAALQFSQRQTEVLQKQLAELVEPERSSAKTKPRRTKLEGSAREMAYQTIESRMEREIAEEARFENLLDACQSTYGGRWENDRLRDFGAFVDRVYLGEGTTERRVLETFENAPESLSNDLRQQAEAAVKGLIDRKVNEAVRDSGLEDPELARLFAVDMRRYYETPAAHKMLVTEYLAQVPKDGEARKPLLRIDTPETAKIALREAVIAQGKISAEQARILLLAMTGEVIDGSNFGYGPDRDRILKNFLDTHQNRDAYFMLPEVERRELNGLHGIAERMSRALDGCAQVEEILPAVREPNPTVNEAELAADLRRDYVGEAERALRELGSLQYSLKEQAEGISSQLTGEADKLRQVREELESLKGSSTEDRWDNQAWTRLVFLLEERHDDGASLTAGQILTNARGRSGELQQHLMRLDAFPRFGSLNADYRAKAEVTKLSDAQRSLDQTRGRLGNHFGPVDRVVNRELLRKQLDKRSQDLENDKLRLAGHVENFFAAAKAEANGKYNEGREQLTRETEALLKSLDKRTTDLIAERYALVADAGYTLSQLKRDLHQDIQKQRDDKTEAERLRKEMETDLERLRASLFVWDKAGKIQRGEKEVKDQQGQEKVITVAIEGLQRQVAAVENLKMRLM